MEEIVSWIRFEGGRDWKEEEIGRRKSLELRDLKKEKIGRWKRYVICHVIED